MADLAAGADAVTAAAVEANVFPRTKIAGVILPGQPFGCSILTLPGAVRRGSPGS